MSADVTIYAFPALKTEGKINPSSGTLNEVHAKKPAMVLDMGEASREQGFRLNGCR